MSLFKRSAREEKTLSLEAQTFLKFKTMFEESEDCLRILTNLGERGLITENVAIKVSRMDGNNNERNG